MSNELRLVSGGVLVDGEPPRRSVRLRMTDARAGTMLAEAVRAAVRRLAAPVAARAKPGARRRKLPNLPGTPVMSCWTSLFHLPDFVGLNIARHAECFVAR